MFSSSATIKPRSWSSATVARKAAVVGLLSAACVAAWAPQAQAAYNAKKAIWGPVDQINVAGKNYDAFTVYKDLGVGIYAAALDWSKIAKSSTRPAGDLTDPANPTYVWPASIDRAIAKAAAANAADPLRPIRISLELTKSPDWASGVTKQLQYAPINPQDFADFATAAARRYPSVHLWMIWGEPNRQKNFCALNVGTFRTKACQMTSNSKFMVFGQAAWQATSLTSEQALFPRTYAKLVDAAFGALHAPTLPGNTENKVIAGDTEPAGDIMPGMWIKYMKLLDTTTGLYTIPPRMDMYGHNPFPMSGRSPTFKTTPSIHNLLDFSDLTRVRDMVNVNLARPLGKSSIPLFLAEFCVPTGPDDGEFSYWVPNSKADPRYVARTDGQDVQDLWITSAMSAAKSASWISALGWIHVADIDPSIYVQKWNNDIPAWNKAHPDKPRTKIFDANATRAGLFYSLSTYKAGTKSAKAAPGFDDLKKPGYVAFKNG